MMNAQRLIDAAVRGDAQFVEQALQLDPLGALQVDAQGFTALMRAAEGGHLHCVESLLAASNANQVHAPTGRLAIEMALEQEWIECARRLREHTNLETQDPETGATPLIRAVQRRQRTGLEFLAACGGFRLRDHEGMSALDWAAAQWPFAVVTLLRNGADQKGTQSPHPQGMTPLMFAMRHANLSGVRHTLLLDPNTRWQEDHQGRDAFVHGLLRLEGPHLKGNWLHEESIHRVQAWSVAVKEALQGLGLDAEAKGAPKESGIQPTCPVSSPEPLLVRKKASMTRENSPGRDALLSSIQAQQLLSQEGPSETEARGNWLRAIELRLGQELAIREQMIKQEKQKPWSQVIAQQTDAHRKTLSAKQLEAANQLTRAVFRNDLQDVQRLLSQHVPLIADYKGLTPLMIAAEKASVDIVRCLLPLSDANARTNRHENAFSFALSTHRWDVAMALLAATDPNDANRETGVTNFMLVASLNRPELVKEWLPQANLTLTDDKGSTAFLHASATRPSKSMIRSSLHPPIEDTATLRLLWARSDPLATDTHGNTALINAVRWDNEPIVQELINHSNVQAQTQTGLDALMSAVLQENVKLIQLLLPHADLSARNGSGDGAWSLASEGKNAEVVDAFAEWIETSQRVLTLRRWGERALPRMAIVQERWALQHSLESASPMQVLAGDGTKSSDALPPPQSPSWPRRRRNL